MDQTFLITVFDLSQISNPQKEICNSHSDVAGDPDLLGCDAAVLSEHLPTFRKIIVPLSSTERLSQKVKHCHSSKGPEPLPKDTELTSQETSTVSNPQINN